MKNNRLTTNEQAAIGAAIINLMMMWCEETYRASYMDNARDIIDKKASEGTKDSLILNIVALKELYGGWPEY